MRRKLIEDLGNVIDGESIAEEVEDEAGGDADASDGAEANVDWDRLSRLLDEESKSAGTIKALRDTDYRDKDAFFKMVELLKGLATVVDEDELAKSFMSAVSDALTNAAKKVTPEDAGSIEDGLEKHADDVLEAMIDSGKHPKFDGPPRSGIEYGEYSTNEKTVKDKTYLVIRNSQDMVEDEKAQKAFLKDVKKKLRVDDLAFVDGKDLWFALPNP